MHELWRVRTIPQVQRCMDAPRHTAGSLRGVGELLFDVVSGDGEPGEMGVEQRR